MPLHPQSLPIQPVRFIKTPLVHLRLVHGILPVLFSRYSELLPQLIVGCRSAECFTVDGVMVNAVMVNVLRDSADWWWQCGVIGVAARSALYFLYIVIRMDWITLNQSICCSSNEWNK